MTASSLLLLLAGLEIVLSLDIAGYTFTTSAGTDWGTMDDYLAQMSNASNGPYHDWASATRFYEKLDVNSGASLSNLVGAWPAGIGTGPVCVDGDYPWFATAALANAVSSVGTSHVITHGGYTGYMPDDDTTAEFGSGMIAYGSACATDVTDATDAFTPPPGKPFIIQASHAYWSDFFYGDTFVRASLDGSGDFADATAWDDESRRELLTKGAAYIVVREALLEMLHRGVALCTAGDTAGAVYDWEAAYALHSGSLEGVDGSGSGKSLYALGDKRCPQFNTCTDGTIKPASCAGGSCAAGNNVRALAAWQRGVANLQASECFAAFNEIGEITSALTVPLVQGMIREAWEIDPNGGEALADGMKEVAEGWAFTAAILPQLAACNATTAQHIRDNMYLNADPLIEDGFASVKAAAESLYGCLGITCAEVGGMLLGDGTPIAGMEPCSDTVATAYCNCMACDDDDDSADSALLALTIVFGVTTLLLAVALLVAVLKITGRRAPPNMPGAGVSLNDNVGKV